MTTETEDLTRLHQQNIPAMLGFQLEVAEPDVEEPNPDPDTPDPEPDPEPDDDGEGDDDSELP